ncbi:hypothetical protein ACOMHN_059089 [Nucella lapillus]
MKKEEEKEEEEKEEKEKEEEKEEEEEEEKEGEKEEEEKEKKKKKKKKIMMTMMMMPDARPEANQEAVVDAMLLIHPDQGDTIHPATPFMSALDSQLMAPRQIEDG